MPEQPIRRRGLALALVVLASIVAFVAMFSVWVNRQVLNTDNWTATSSQLLEEKVIRDRVAGFLVDELYANVDVAGEIRAALPPRAQPLAGPAAGALRSFAERAARELLARPRAQLAWEAANRNAHELLIKVLEGGGPIVSTQRGRRDARPQGAARGDAGARRARRPPGRERLPADAAEITILRVGPARASPRTPSGSCASLPIVLVSLSLLLFAIALIISPGWRRKAVRAYGIGFIAAGALGLAAIVGARRHGGRLARPHGGLRARDRGDLDGRHDAAARDRRVHDRLRRPDVARRAPGGPHARRHRDPALPGALPARARVRLRRPRCCSSASASCGGRRRRPRATPSRPSCWRS